MAFETKSVIGAQIGRWSAGSTRGHTREQRQQREGAGYSGDTFDRAKSHAGSEAGNRLYYSLGRSLGLL